MSTRLLVFAALVVALLAAPATGYSLVLSPQDIQDAIAYGERRSNPQNRSISMSGDTMYTRTLVIEAAPEVARVMWMTTFLYLAAVRANMGRPLNAGEIKDTLDRGRERAIVGVVTQTKADVVPREVRILVQRPDGSVLRPERTESERVGQTAAGLYINNIRAWFRYRDGLTPTETVKVILGWGARSLSVEFNLAELR